MVGLYANLLQLTYYFYGGLCAAASPVDNNRNTEILFVTRQWGGIQDDLLAATWLGWHAGLKHFCIVTSQNQGKMAWTMPGPHLFHYVSTLP